MGQKQEPGTRSWTKLVFEHKKVKYKHKFGHLVLLQADSQNKNFYSNQDLNYVTTATNLLAFLKTKLGGLVTLLHYFTLPFHYSVT